MNNKPKILVVDDEESAREFVKRVLNQSAYEVYTAVSGVDALVLLEQHPDMDVLLLDIMMPVLDGFEVLNIIQSNPTLAGLKIIMLSAMDEVAGKVRAFSAGAHDYLVKPIEKAELLARLQTHIRLKQSEAALQAYNTQLEREILERKQIEQELRIARDEAESAARTKSAFLANMSHEIRTPLNAVIGMTTLLIDTPLDEEQTEFVNTVRSSSNSLLSIINDILDYSKIEAGHLSLENSPFSLRSCLEEALDLVSAKATEKNLDLLYFIEDNVPSFVIGDITRLRQVLVNLLSNAVKFTHEGEIVIHVKKVSANNTMITLEISIRDTGIGIPADRVSQLFQAFSQADVSTTRQFGGTGLGLVISKNLVEMMGGSIRVESEPGKGSVFTFMIIIGNAPESMTAAWDEQMESLVQKRVLIVDDNETNCFILSRQTEKWGMIPETAVSANEALEKMGNGRVFDLAILDMQMPHVDGITLAAQIRASQNTAQLPLILLSSLGQKQPELAGLKITWQLTKPVKRNQLHTAINSIFTHQDEYVPAAKPVKQTRRPDYSGFSPSLKILLAEDNIINQKVALGMLTRLGYMADVASNGHEVIEKLQKLHYDVILMDVQMPEMDGVATTKHILANCPNHRPRIIAMTANALEGDRENYLDAGMDDYISKPIRIDILKQVLERSWETAVSPQ
ncbi:MAG: response regulator [Ardenticatenaceae bacterium]|nr:response regulator [Ardenticatenaceae bacterium]MCB9444789.1 response regulator [Ardenticatenaceae bacterium]